MRTAFRTVQDWMLRDAGRLFYAPLHTLARPERRTPRHAGRPELRRLPAHAVVGFAVAETARVTCLGGELWVTGPGTGDQVLSSGGSLTVSGRGRIVAEALRDARFVIVR